MHPSNSAAPTPLDAKGGLPRTTRLLEEEVDVGLWTKGAQICVVIGDQTRQVAIGDRGTGEPMMTDTIFKIYCAIKPVTAIAVAKLVEAGALDLDQPLRHLLPHYRVLAERDITLRHVLSHTAGLHVPPTVELELLPPAKRQTRLESAAPPDDWQIGFDAAYSEYFGWHLLGEAVEVISDQPLRQHLRDSVLDPLGLTHTWIGMTADEYDANYERLGVSWGLHGHKSSPMLLELSERWCCETNCASGGYTTAEDFARFYAALAAQLNDGDNGALPSRTTLAEFCSSARPRTYDHVLQRECEYGLGFMVNLSEHFYGSHCSERAMGHSGLAGSSFAFADPANEMGAAVILNGIIDGPSSLLRRQRLTETLYEDVAAIVE